MGISWENHKGHRYKKNLVHYPNEEVLIGDFCILICFGKCKRGHKKKWLVPWCATKKHLVKSHFVHYLCVKFHYVQVSLGPYTLWWPFLLLNPRKLEEFSWFGLHWKLMKGSFSSPWAHCSLWQVALSFEL